MSPEKWSGLLSAIVGVSVLVVAYTTWFDVAYGGSKISVRAWAKVLYATLIAVQLVAMVLLLAA